MKDKAKDRLEGRNYSAVADLRILEASLPCDLR